MVWYYTAGVAKKVVQVGCLSVHICTHIYKMDPQSFLVSLFITALKILWMDFRNKSCFNEETEHFSSYLLLSVNGQTGTGNRELHNEHHEQDDHILSVSVKEQQQIHTLYKIQIILLTVSVHE